jgi:hypothetical protein
MQNPKQAKLPCRIICNNQEAEGIAQLVEVYFSPAFTAWFGYVSPELDPAGALEWSWMNARIDFKDGRCGEIYIGPVATDEVYIGDHGLEPGQTVILYFTGLRTLGVPTALPHS